MRIHYYLFIALFWSSTSIAQSVPDASTTVNALALPEAPGFILLDGAPVAIEQPASVTDFAVSILTQTQSGTAFPERYAVQLAPFWLAGAHRSLSYRKYAAPATGLDALGRTLTLSVATDRLESAGALPQRTVLAAGARFALLTGELDTTGTYGETLRRIRALLSVQSQTVAAYLDQRRQTDAAYLALEQQQNDAVNAGQIAVADRIMGEMAVRVSEFRTERPADNAARADTLSDLASSLRERRIGPTLETAAALRLDFPNADADAGRLSRWGAWVTGGFAGHHTTALALARYLYDDSADTLATSALDVGVRLIHDANTRFSISAEGVFRAGLDGTEDRYRADVAVAYALDATKRLRLTFGRDYDGSQSGNLLALLDIVVGLGANRPAPR